MRIFGYKKKRKENAQRTQTKYRSVLISRYPLVNHEVIMGDVSDEQHIQMRCDVCVRLYSK